MEKEFRIYTKTGDQGETSLVGGTRVKKNHPRIEAYGDLDELKSWIGLIRDQEIGMDHRRTLLEIQDRLFTMESHLAAESAEVAATLPKLSAKHALILESEIDRMNENLPPISSFILPGGCAAASMCHIARTVCRRVERKIISLMAEIEVDHLIIQYINRLSDYLFVLARALTYESNGTETPWLPKR
ncbi:MAG: cob(I)yrinic acid a,c-diamide adenosyltransferase [Bacteroidales bacterium]